MSVIWTNTQFTASALKLLNDGIAAHQLIESRLLSASTWTAATDADPALDTADVALGQPDPEGVMRAERLRWIHLTSAGYTRYDTPEFRAAMSARGIAVTNSSTVYSEPCAEHILAFMLGNARRLPQAVEAQRRDHSWGTAGFRSASRLMLNQNVVILGFGAIARRLVELLSPFAMKITALRRNPTGAENVTIVSEAGLGMALAHADHVVNILPDNPRTRNFVTKELFAAMRPGSVFYNIGRGTTVDQGALLAALHAEHLAGAYLDVTDPEPLPPEHSLWTAPNCLITPHTSGGHDNEMEKLVLHFLGNLRKFVTGSPLKDRIM